MDTIITARVETIQDTGDGPDVAADRIKRPSGVIVLGFRNLFLDLKRNICWCGSRSTFTRTADTIPGGIVGSFCL